MVYSSKDFNVVDFCRDSTKYASIMALAAPKVESLWFFKSAFRLCKSGKAERSTKAEGLPKNISIEEFLDEPSGKAERCTKHGVLGLAKRAELERTFRLSTNGTGRRIRRFTRLR